MQANMAALLKDVLENKRIFYIPVYQRNYSWKEEQCKQLFEDIMKLYNQEYQEHFVGAIVWKADDSNSNLLGVIDGQQRLTTMFLLIKALKDINTDRRLERALEDILCDYREDENRLIPIKSDNEVYCKVINNEFEEIKNKSNRILQNYLYFKSEFEKRDIDVQKFFDALDKLKVVRMELGYLDNPQVIFESINSTGMSLSIADLIRNYLLMNEEYSLQKSLFEKYWFKFEQKLGLDNLILFFEHYLNIKIKDKQINRNNMYKYFKKYFEDNNLTAESLLSSLVDYVDAYVFLINKDVNYSLANVKESQQLNCYRNELIELGNKVAYLFLLPVVMDHKNNKLSDEELLHSFNLTLSYIVRRSIVGLGTNVLQGVFRRLYTQIEEYKEKYGYINALNYSLITSRRNTTAIFPSDEEFFTAIHTRNLYGKYRYMNYLLFKLENHDNKTVLSEDNISIEHVMPQTLNSEWKTILGDNWKELHEENVNDIGNLTLTSYNSSLSNFSFQKKQEILLEESHIKLNQYFHKVDKWDVEEIEKRGRKLAEKALSIWPIPIVNTDIANSIEEAKYNSTYLSELIENYISVKPTKIIIEDAEYTIKSFRSLLSTVINFALNINRNKFYEYFVNNEEYVRMNKGIKFYIISDDIEKIYSPEEVTNVENNIYWDSNRSGYQICTLARDILNVYAIDESTILIKYYK